jgi:hypothetical protein
MNQIKGKTFSIYIYLETRRSLTTKLFVKGGISDGFDTLNSPLSEKYEYSSLKSLSVNTWFFGIPVELSITDIVLLS